MSDGRHTVERKTVSKLDRAAATGHRRGGGGVRWTLGVPKVPSDRKRDAKMSWMRESSSERAAAPSGGGLTTHCHRKPSEKIRLDGAKDRSLHPTKLSWSSTWITAGVGASALLLSVLEACV